ncbi:MAG: penicillin-binding protein 2 [Proteobacteria bacterium]|nr:penicillin-binding protein 2 [Pseudomonadota bacterium]MDA1023039.1 penicillin-binding protein 2 [Pseudomonadota bacterium]
MTARKNKKQTALRIEGAAKQAIETGRNRLLVTGVILSLAFSAIVVRLVDLTVFKAGGEPTLAHAGPVSESPTERADIVDRNGVILATSLPTASLFADPATVLNPEEAANRLITVLDDLDRKDIVAKLNSKSRFVWVARNLTPEQHYQINRLGLPGFSFQRGERRVYPHGRLASHVLGLTDVDGRGIAGLEQYFERGLRTANSVKVSMDIRIQAILHQELVDTVKKFRAIGAAGLVMDVNSGEMVAMVSLPDFDPNAQSTVNGEKAFNRATKGVYEMGSTFKLFTAAMALDSGTVTMQSGYDASQPIKVGRFTISDYHGKNRWLSVPEIIVYSSNIGAAKMAMDVGGKGQQEFLGRLGLLKPAALELPEVGKPLTPGRWRDINTMTISYGHGIAVTPVQLAAGISAIVNGGIYRSPTLIAQDADSPRKGRRVLSAETSEQMRTLMRMVVQSGTGRKAAVEGYAVGGKTGTADKQVGRGYAKKVNISSFVGAFPIEAPRYVALVIVDEPKGNKDTFNYATGGWVAAPAFGRVVNRMATLVGMTPDRTPQAAPSQSLMRQASLGANTGTSTATPKPRAVLMKVHKKAERAAERKLLNRVRAVLSPTQKTSGAVASGPPEQALATF